MVRDTARNSLEIEGKFRVSSHRQIRKNLRELRIPQAGVEVQRDIYFFSPIRDFVRTDEALRIRYTNGEAILTYKGPKLAVQGLKAREEVNVKVTTGEDLERIFQRLGFVLTYTVEKTRERYEWEGVEIGLDEVKGLGTFVEIEVKNSGDRTDERIEEMKKKLGIEGEHIPLSYLELLRLKETADRPEYPSPLR
jgi:adenylate cyclase class 2